MSTDDPFVHVPAGLAEALRERGFTTLTPVQTATLAPELRGRDLRIASRTGSGKTVALGFALAELLRDVDQPYGKPARPVALMIAPTRELAVQIADELRWLYAPLAVRVDVLTGGTPIGGDFRKLKQNPAVLVGTPGRLVDHLERGSLAVDTLQAAVLDEADRLLDMGFREELERILRDAPDERRTHLVSATFPDAVEALANAVQHDPAPVEGENLDQAHADIDHELYVLPREQRLPALINLLLFAPRDKTLVFVRTRADTANIASDLVAEGLRVAALHGDMSQRERTMTLEAFRAGNLQAVIATDVAARGLDVSDIKRVIHADPPFNAEDFTHRSGRTGRAGNKGRSLLLVPPRAVRHVRRLLRGLKIEAADREIPGPEQVIAAADERLVASLDEDHACPERLRKLANRLLESQDPEELVARLLVGSHHTGPCAPRRMPKYAQQGSGRRRASERRRAGERHAGPRRCEKGPWVPFQMSWGHMHGANPRKVLAVICRRGGVDSRKIGAIRIAERSSKFEVLASSADAFARAARKPDSRDPRIKIRPWMDRRSRSS